MFPMRGAGEWSWVKHTCSGADLQELHFRDLEGCEPVSQYILHDERVLVELETYSFACDTRDTLPLWTLLVPKRRPVLGEMSSTPSM